MELLKYISVIVFVLICTSLDTGRSLVLSLDLNHHSGKIAVDKTGINYCTIGGTGDIFRNNGYATLTQGTSDYINCGNNSNVNFTNEFTMSFWINQGATVGVVNKQTTSTTGFSYNIVANSDFRIYSQFSSNGTTVAYSNTNPVVRSGAWTHVVSVYYGSRAASSDRSIVYVNGIQQSLSFTGTIPTSLYQTSSPLAVNRYNGSTYGTAKMKFIKLDDKVWTATEVWSLYVKEYNLINQQ